MNKRTVYDVLETLNKSQSDGRNVLVRVDFNVPLTSDLEVADDSRIRGALSTIKTILQLNCNVILLSHLGRPKLVQQGREDDETKKQRKALSLHPVAKRLGDILGETIVFVNDCIGEETTQAVRSLPTNGGSILLLENLRFHKAEEQNNPNFARELAKFGDAYINDAFGTCHRAHASVTGIPAVMDPQLCGIGCLVASELSYLNFNNISSEDCVAAVVGGSKVSTKLPLIRELLEKVDVLVLGGGLAFTFVKAKGIRVGKSLVEDSMVDLSKEIMADAAQRGKTIILPVDAVCTSRFPACEEENFETRTFSLYPGSEGVHEDWMGLDVGPETQILVRDGLSDANRIVMNGPLGVFEIPPFDAGTRFLVDVLAKRTNEGCTTVIGGGDSAAAVQAFGMSKEVSYVSTGGGATIELLAGAILPGVAAIADNE